MVTSGHKVHITEQELDKYVDLVVHEAKEFVARPANDERVFGKKDDPKRAGIEAFLKPAADQPHPYDDPKVRGAIREMLLETFKDAQRVAGTPENIYLAGPLGSKKIMQDLMAKGEGASPAIAALRKQLAGSVTTDYEVMKERFSALSGHNVFDNSKPQEPYGQWRGVFYGTAQAIKKIAEAKEVNVMVDNTMAVDQGPVAANGRSKPQNDLIDQLRIEGQERRVRIYAVALGTEESLANYTGKSRDENVKSAANFPAMFNLLRNMEGVAANLTVMDANGEVMYQRKSGKELECKALPIAQWQTRCVAAAAPEINLKDALPPAPPLKGLAK